MRKELPFGMERAATESPDDLAASVTMEEGAFLTSLHLAGNMCGMNGDMAANAEERGLAVFSEGKAEVTAPGMKAVSLFPLFGKEAAREAYPEAFFPALLSLAASRALSSDDSHWKRVLSSVLPYAFPSLDASRLVNAAMLALRRFIELGIALDEDVSLSLDRDEAEKFMLLPEAERIALMAGSYDTDKLTHAVSLSFLLSGIPEEDLDGYLGVIGKITGKTPDAETLMTLPVLDSRDGIVTGRKMPQKKAGSIVVSSDFTISYTGWMPDSFYLFSELSKCDAASEWRITKSSVKAAFSLGMKPEEIRDRLQRLSEFPLPEMLYQRISSWYSSFSSIRAERALILYTDERNGRIVEALPTMRPHILGKLGENVFLMEPQNESLWRRALENAGFDMLGPTEGPSIVWHDRKISQLPSTVPPLPEVPERRAVPFDSGRRQRIMDGAGDELRKILTASGFIISEDQETPRIDTVNGLYYQEKLHLIHSACQGGCKLYLEDTDGKAIAGKAEKTEDSGTVSLGGRRIRISKVWKAALLPAGVYDWESEGIDEAFR